MVFVIKTFELKFYWFNQGLDDDYLFTLSNDVSKSTN